MIETATSAFGSAGSWFGAISWTWTGAAILLVLAGVGLCWLGQIQLGVMCFAAAAGCFWIGDLYQSRDFAIAQRIKAEEREAQVTLERDGEKAVAEEWRKVATEQTVAAEEHARRTVAAQVARKAAEAEAAKLGARYASEIERLSARILAPPVAGYGCDAAWTELELAAGRAQ